MRHPQLIANLVLILALGVGVAAEQGGTIRREEPPRPSREIERSAVVRDSTWRPNGTGATRVVGSVIDIRRIPVAGVTIQLRNLDTGTVDQKVNSNELGEYEFAVDESGTYIVEMVMADGYIVGLSNAGSLARFETLQTVVQLPGRWDAATRVVVMQQNMTAFVGMSAETTMTATSIQIAVDHNVRPANPGISVSPS